MSSAPASRPIVVVAITGASGAAIGVRVLELLRQAGRYEVHLVISAAGAATLAHETGLSPAAAAALADVSHDPADVGAAIASGSTPVAAMLVTPCSIRTLSAVAHGLTGDLVTRAADVTLKEGRPLLLLVRESPVHAGHLRSMAAVADLGGVIAFPVPAFYKHPASLSQVIDDVARRALARAGLPGFAGPAWPGLEEAANDRATARGGSRVTNEESSMESVTSEYSTAEIYMKQS
jgi:4-hydroxy-3-polyprenylbenzoate decarboxylase